MDVFTALINNISLLFVLSILYGFISRQLKYDTITHKLLAGLLFGGVTVAGMMNPLRLTPGIIFDGRSIIISVAGLFGGPVTAVIAAIIAGAYRYWISGMGAITGICVIIASAIIGVIYHYVRLRRSDTVNLLNLFGFGIIVHVSMLLLMLTLPSSASLAVLKDIALPVILIFPVATVIICKLFLDQEARIAIEESFKKSEKQFSLMAENIHEGLTIVEPGNTIFINDRACEITGHTREELQHMKTTDVVTPEYRPLIMEAEGKFWETGTLPEAIEFEIIRKDGSRRFISNSYSASWKDGKVISRYIITNDITERKRAEAAIRESEERFRLANLATFNAIWDWDLQTNSLWWNENFKTLFGYRAEEIEPSIESWTSRIHPEDLSRIETGIHAAIDSGQQYWSDQYRFRRKDGMYAEVEDRGYIDREAGGNPVRMIGAMQDITERKRAEEAVKKSELKYRELFDTMNDGFVITDLKGTILECNTAYAEMLGYEKEELKRLSYQDLTPPKWHAIEEHIVNNQFLKRGYSDWYEKEYIRKDGTIFPVSHRGRLLKDEQGMPIGMWGFIRNITEEKKAGEALRESEARYRVLFDSINDALFVHYVEEAGVPGSFSQVNDVACKRLGYTREELLALSPRDITTPEAYETISAARERLVSTGEVIIETVHVTKDGNKIPTESSVRLFNYLGRQAAISIARDITERKRAEEAIVWMAQEWKRTFDSMSEAIWILDKDFWVLRSNKTAEHIFNRPCAEMVGKHCWEIVHGTTQPIPECPIIRAKKSLYHESQELQIGESCFEINVDPFLNKDGQLVGAVHVVRDITERKRAEAEKEKLRAQLFQSQKMETVGLLAGGIAHDFNNILAAIMGYANLLQTKMSAADPLYSHVEHILSSSERAATLVHSLLAFSRKQTLSVKQVKINDLVSGVAKLLVRLLGEDITLETVFTSRDPLIMADAGQIDQILFNLATNARDAMPGGGHLTITTDITEIDDTYITEHGYGVLGDYALLTVSDTGAGMDKAAQGKIFEPFFTTKEVGKGTGLGLSTAYGIVKQHNGFINCYSEPGTGTTFKIYLPLLEPDTKAENEKTGKRNELMPEGTETILVAEDDAAVKELIINILSQYGYTVYEAEDGAQAVQVFTEHAQEIDLLVFDIIMPRKNGKEAYKEIQSIRPEVPVLFTSGYTADIIHKKSFLEEGFELILKPVSMSALLQKVREILDRSIVHPP